LFILVTRHSDENGHVRTHLHSAEHLLVPHAFDDLARDLGRSSAAPLPGVFATPGKPHETADQDRFSVADRLTASEQAIQLDELIKWVERQSQVEPSR
jgi:hypothetical protein